jgi:DNA polymerase V
MKVNYIGKISEENLPAIFVPYFLESVHAGFPSPASDYIESPIDLNKHLIKNGAATFLVRAQGQSMIGSGITDQAVLVVDRSVKPVHNSIVVASIDGEFVCKRLKLKPKCA